MNYTKTNWQNLPNTTTPINATNLNNMETGIEAANVLGEAAALKGVTTTSSGTASSSSTTGSYITACSVSLTTGTYLILGASEGSIDSSTNSVITKFTYSGATLVGGKSNYRGTMIAGGGLTSWIIVSVQTSGTVNLQNYVNSNYSVASSMTAIRLI